MPTINQLVQKGRSPKFRGTPSLSLNKNPQQKGTCIRVYTMNPRKPNSAERKVTRVRLSSGIEVIAYIPKEGHKLQEHSQVLVRGAKVKDLPGVRFSVIRGKFDATGVDKRRNGRSKCGTKKPKSAKGGA